MEVAVRFSSFKNITNPRKQALLSVNIVTRTTGHLFARNLWHMCSTTSEESKACNLKIITPTILCSCGCGGQLLRYTKSEQFLVQFLSEEIAAEFKAHKIKTVLCKTSGFHVKLDESEGTLTKKSGNETIVVVFSVNHIVDTAADDEPELNPNMDKSRFC